MSYHASYFSFRRISLTLETFVLLRYRSSISREPWVDFPPNIMFDKLCKSWPRESQQWIYQLKNKQTSYRGLKTVLIKVLYECCGSWPQKVLQWWILSWMITSLHCNQTVRIFELPERWGLWCSSGYLLFICFCTDLVRVLATTGNTSAVAGYTRA